MRILTPVLATALAALSTSPSHRPAEPAAARAEPAPRAGASAAPLREGPQRGQPGNPSGVGVPGGPGPGSTTTPPNFGTGVGNAGCPPDDSAPSVRAAAALPRHRTARCWFWLRRLSPRIRPLRAPARRASWCPSGARSGGLSAPSANRSRGHAADVRCVDASMSGRKTLWRTRDAGGVSIGILHAQRVCEICDCGARRPSGAADFVVFHCLTFCSPDCRDDYRSADEDRRAKKGR